MGKKLKKDFRERHKTSLEREMLHSETRIIPEESKLKDADDYRGLFREQFLPEHQPHRPFPGLRGHSGPGSATINSGFWASGIIPVQAAGGNGLQHMKVNIKAFLFHIHTPFLVIGLSPQS